MSGAEDAQGGEAGNGLSRRNLLLSAGGLTVAGLVSACDPKSPHSNLPVPPRQPHLVRVVTVFTPIVSGLLPSLTREFTAASGFEVKFDAQNDVFGPGRAGDADLLICHYGHVGIPGRLPGQAETEGEGEASDGASSTPTFRPGHPPPGYGPGHPRPGGPRASAASSGTAAPRRYDVERFVLEGYGEWPLAVFANQAVLLGPSHDPANVNGLRDAAEALRRIAETKSTLLVSEDFRIRYILELLRAAAGVEPGDWYQQTELGGTMLLSHAKEQQAYTMWGDVAPLTVRSGLLRMVVADPVLQREMVGTVVDPAKVAGVNEAGARAFLRYLLTPETQARIRNYRAHPDDPQYWWPIGVANDESALPIGS